MSPVRGTFSLKGLEGLPPETFFFFTRSIREHIHSILGIKSIQQTKISSIYIRNLIVDSNEKDKKITFFFLEILWFSFVYKDKKKAKES